jgi:hypothetical protein
MLQDNTIEPAWLDAFESVLARRGLRRASATVIAGKAAA